MSELKPVLVLGGGGHTRVLIDTLNCQNRTIAGVLSSSLSIGSEVFGHCVLGDDTFLKTVDVSLFEVVLGVGGIKSTDLRVELYELVKMHGFRVATVIHPSAIIADGVQLGEGAQVMAGAVLQPGVEVGANAIVNTRASLDHDVLVRSHAHIAPGVICSGGVEIGVGSHVGTGAVIIQGVKVGEGCLVAAGSVVVNDLSAGEAVKGVPARSF